MKFIIFLFLILFNKTRLPTSNGQNIIHIWDFNCAKIFFFCECTENCLFAFQLQTNNSKKPLKEEIMWSEEGICYGEFTIKCRQSYQITGGIYKKKRRCLMDANTTFYSEKNIYGNGSCDVIKSNNNEFLYTDDCKNEIKSKWNYGIQYQQINENEILSLKNVINGLIKNSTRKHILLGPGTLSAIVSTGMLINDYWIPQIVYKWTSPLLSNRTVFNRLFKLLPSDELSNEAIIKILLMNEWKVISLLQDDKDNINEYSKLLRQSIKNYNISTRGSFIMNDNISQQMDLLKTINARIMVNLLYNSNTNFDFECNIYNKGLYGSHYQWLMNGFSTTNTSNCSIDSIFMARQGTIIVKNEIFNYSFPVDFIGKQGFIDYIRVNLQRNITDLSLDNLLLIDSLWTIYLGFNYTRILFNSTVLGADYVDTQAEFEILTNNIRNISFIGLTGPVSFDGNGDRISRVNLFQFQNKSYVKCGFYDPIMKAVWMNSSFWFRDGIPPKDTIRMLSIIRVIDRPTYYIFLVISVILVFISLLFISINIKYRALKFVKMSSPNLNNLMAGGIVASYVSILPIGYSPDSIDNLNSSKWICHMRVWLLMLSFDCIFGSLFSKTWRIHMIFSKSKMHKKNVIKDFHLFLIIAGIILLDIVILFIWELTDNITWCSFADKVQESIEVLTENTYVLCCSTYGTYYMSILFSIKGILLLIGLYFAWETRKVHIEILNDSKQVGMAIYIVMMMAIVIIPLEYMIDQRQITPAFFVLAAAIIICSFTTLSLVFVPKFIKMWQVGIAVEHKIENFTSRPP